MSNHTKITDGRASINWKRAGRKLLEAERRDCQQTAEIVARFFNLKAEDLA